MNDTIPNSYTESHFFMSEKQHLRTAISAHTCVCVCVCVSQRERDVNERERADPRDKFQTNNVN